MYIIKIKYKIIKHPYPTEINRTIYGEIYTALVDKNNNEIKIFTQQIWDLVQYFEWFIKNEKALLNDKMPSFMPIGLSISQRIQKYLAELDEDDATYDNYYNYSISHSYNVSMYGCGDSAVYFPSPIYIGLGNDGYEVSMYSEEYDNKSIQLEHWKYVIDLKSTIEFVKKEYSKIINSPIGHNEINRKKYFS